MCGIAGIIDAQTAPAERLRLVQRMCEAMAHRGPDDRGAESEGEATLGVRRLAIFDPGNGHQPMQTPDGRLILVFNGSIINFRSLRAELEASWKFRTHCDTEVLLAAYARWGPNCLGRLRGMFAFAVWDTSERSLFLARDPFGIKPLYYRWNGKRLCFASEINGLLADGGGAAIDPASAAEYLTWFSVPAPRTIYRGILSLRPGERALFHHGRLDFHRYWNFESIPPQESPCRSRPEFVRELRSRLEDTIRAHALADVPVGVFLSGGLDSAVVAALMSRASGTRLRTFTVGFSEKGYSEAEAAASLARHLGTDHHGYVVTGTEAADNIGKFIDACDQPTGDGLNTYYASRLARAEGATVVLSGLGGDELFGGYPSFRNLPRIAAWLPYWRALPSSVRDLLLAPLRRGDTRKRKLADFLYYARDFNELASMQRRVFSEPGRRALLAPAVAAAVAHRSPFHPELTALREDLLGADGFENASAWELRGYMADLLLRDSDVMSMRHSLELRVPYVDRPFIEWLWRQPTQYKFTPRHPKAAMAAAVADLLPPAMRRQPKQGFSFPMALWLRRELKPFLDETFSSASVDRSGLFARPAVQSQWRQFLVREDPREWSRIWSLAVLVAFVNRAAPPPPVPEAAGAGFPGSHSTVAAGVAKAARPRSSFSAPRPAPRHPAAAQPAQGSHCTLLLTPEIFSSVGGIPRILRIYLKALCELAEGGAGRVRLISLNDPELDSRDLRRYSNGSLDDWYVCGRRRKRFVRQAFRMSRGCDRLLCGHIGQLPVAWMIRCLRPRVSYYVVAHGIDVWRPFSLLKKVALQRATRVLCVSDFTRREMLKYCRLRPSQMAVIPNALDPGFEIRLGRPLAECPPVILTVTRLSYNDRYKGLEHLIQAMRSVRASVPDARLRIIGEGDDRRRLVDIARREGLAGDGVEFLGYLDDRRLADEMAQCRVLALPSHKEGFGIVFLEAMANGRPCLGARAAGTSEVITEETGILVEFGNVAAIAEGCVAALCRNWDQAAILERVRQFSYARFKDRLAGLIDRAPVGTQ